MPADASPDVIRAAAEASGTTVAEWIAKARGDDGPGSPDGAGDRVPRRPLHPPGSVSADADDPPT